MSDSADLVLERQILAQLERLTHAKTNFWKRIEASRVRALIAQRSASQIERMERSKGLRK